MVRKALLYDLLGGTFVLLFLITNPANVIRRETKPRDVGSDIAGRHLLTSVTTPKYEVLDLGMPGGAHHIKPLGISPNGRYVVGYVSTHTIMRAFMWSDGKCQYLSNKHSIAYAVNDSGVAVGEHILDATRSRAVMWQGNQEKMLFQPQTISCARAVDNKGNIYGEYDEPEGRQSFLRLSDGTVTNLNIDSARCSLVVDSSQNKQVVLSQTYDLPGGDTTYKTVVWRNHKLQELLPLEEGERCHPSAINDGGIVVGWTPKGSARMPVIWKNGEPTVLDILRWRSGVAFGINNEGSILLNARTEGQDEATSYIIYKKKIFAIKDLVQGDFPAERLLKIADSGAILAEGKVDRILHGFLLVPKQ